MSAALTRALAATRSMRVVDRDRLGALEHIDAIVVIGASCAGKTTLVEAVRGSDLVAAGRVDVPTRLITRPPRTGDDVRENLHVSEAELDAQVRAGRVGLRWVRPLAGRAVRYGFRPPRTGTLPVYSANSAIVSATADVEPAGALARALVIGVHAPDPVRARRLAHRSPDLWNRPDEVADRLGEPADRVFAAAHVAVENHGELEAVAPAELLALVRMLVA